MKDPESLESVRIDKWLWAVRICKLRKDAAELCKRDKVLIDDQYCKPSREVKAGQQVSIKKDGLWWKYKVLKCIEKRVGAKIADLCKENITPEEEIKKHELIKSSWTPSRPQGMGRPTKKDRRDWEKELGP